MSITATELKENLGKYLMMCMNDDIFITKNGKIIAKLSNPFMDKYKILDELTGIAKGAMSEEEAKEDRANNI